MRLVLSDNNTEREGTATFGCLPLKQLDSFLKQMLLVKKSPLEVSGPNHWAGDGAVADKRKRPWSRENGLWCLSQGEAIDSWS